MTRLVAAPCAIVDSEGACMPCLAKQKKKGPTYYTSEGDLEPFGFKLNDIIRTPLGVTGTVIGVK